MRRFFKMVGIAMVGVAVLAVALVGTVAAAGGNPDEGTQNQGETCLCGACEPNEYAYSHEYLAPGPHGDGSSADEGTQTQNKGETCLCGDCVCGDCEQNNYSYSYSYAYSEAGPNGAQEGNCYSYSEAGPNGAQQGVLE